MDHPNAFAEFSPQFEAPFGTQLESFEFEGPDWSGEAEHEFEFEFEYEVFDEAELMELAGELLAVDSEAELDQFLGKLVRRVGSAVGRAVRSPLGRQIGGFLKGAAKRALPLAGAALGGMVGGPLGAKIGSGLANAAGGALGLEAEMLSPEDQEFEGAKQFVRLGGQAVRAALQAPAGANTAAAAQQAVTSAAAQLAPGLLQGRPSRRPPMPAGGSGRWVRQGRNVLLLNV